MVEAQHGVTILVVDDEPDLELLIRHKFRQQIRAQSVQFTFAGDGREALDRLAANDAIDIVVTDINMPRMDGLTLLSRIQALERTVKVIVVSAYNDLSNIRTAMNRGAFDFITKPIDFQDLWATIEKTQLALADLRRGQADQQALAALHRELEIASTIQSSALPSRFPAFPERPEVDLHATMLPAQEVGGDFYDFYLLDEDHLGFALGDVSGKGLGAAIFMAITRTLLKATALQGLAPADCLRYVNRILYPDSMPQMFVTVFYGTLNLRDGTLTYCNAGHPPPLRVSRSAPPSPLPRTRALGLCLHHDFDFRGHVLTLAPGDALLLFSDGVTEAVNPSRVLYEDERLQACLAQSHHHEPAHLIRDVLNDLTAFTEGALQSDDITMLAVQYHG